MKQGNSCDALSMWGLVFSKGSINGGRSRRCGGYAIVVIINIIIIIINGIMPVSCWGPSHHTAIS